MEPNDNIRCYLCNPLARPADQKIADIHIKINHDHIKCYLCNIEFTDKKHAVNHLKIDHKHSFTGCGCHHVYDCHHCHEELTDCECHGVDDCHLCGQTISYDSALCDLKIYGRNDPSTFQKFLSDPLYNIKCFPCKNEFTDKKSAVNHRENTKAPKSESAKSNNRNRNRQFRLFDYEVYLSINNRQKNICSQRNKRVAGPYSSSSFKQHGSKSLPTQPVDNYDWAL